MRTGEIAVTFDSGISSRGQSPIWYPERMAVRESMKALVFERYGSPDVLSLETVPCPLPSKGKVRVRVHASTVSRTDTATLRAHPFFVRAMTGLIRPKMRVLGMDFAGEIDLLG